MGMEFILNILTFGGSKCEFRRRFHHHLHQLLLNPLEPLLVLQILLQLILLMFHNSPSTNPDSICMTKLVISSFILCWTAGTGLRLCREPIRCQGPLGGQGGYIITHRWVSSCAENERLLLAILQQTKFLFTNLE